MQSNHRKETLLPNRNLSSSNGTNSMEIAYLYEYDPVTGSREFREVET